jgi:hypothetical protein
MNFRGPPALGFADYGRIYHCEATLVGPHDSRTAEQWHDTEAPASFRHLPSSPSGLPGDGDGGELRRPSVCLGEAGEPAPSGARPRPSPLRLPPHRRLVGPVQSRKRRIPPSSPIGFSSGDSWLFFWWCPQLPMERAADAIWELSCVLPSRHGELADFFLSCCLMAPRDIEIPSW